MGSSSDSRIMHGAAEILDSFSIPHEDQIISAHRTPERLDEYAKHAEKSNFKVIIAGAGESGTSSRNDCITYYNSCHRSSNHGV